MAGIEAFLKGWVSRILPQAESDNDPGLVRLGRYGDVITVGAVRKQHALGDEGSYFVTNNAQTGIAGPAIASFTAASPMIIITNSDSSSNQGYKRIHLDYVALMVTAAGGWASAGALCQLAVLIDSGDRYSSAGTDISANIVSPNMDVASRASVAKVRFGAVTATTATGAVRTVVGLRTIRFPVSATVANIVGDAFQLNFGGVETAPSILASAAGLQANALKDSTSLPPIIIGPNQSALIYYILNGTTPSAASFAPELGWWER